jgi:hypothetical protein
MRSVHRPDRGHASAWHAERTQSPRRSAIKRKIEAHEHLDSFEGPKRRRQRRPPKGRENVTRLIGDDGLAAPGTALRRLQERGFVHEILG